MKHQYQNKIIKFCSFLLVVFGFGSCNLLPKMEYGTPSADYQVNGRVVSAIGKKPVKGIRAVMSENPDDPYRRDTTFTDLNGEFTLFIKNGWPDDPKKLSVIFEDIDEEQNGGTFETKEMDVTFTNPTYKGKKGNWYQGKATQEIGDVEI